MKLSEFAVAAKKSLYEELVANRPPSQGRYDVPLFTELSSKGKPQMGSTRFFPGSIKFEFIYSEAQGATHIFIVEVDAPERIVFLPVPEWVVENIWQGDVQGSFQFESEAIKQYQSLGESLEPEANAPLFAQKAPTRRE